MTQQFKCARCNGSGKTCFDHIENGVCFDCDGTGLADFQRKARKFAPIVRSQEDVREGLRHLYLIMRDYAHDADLQRRQLTYTTGQNSQSRATSIARDLTAARGELRTRAEAAFRALLGQNWNHVAAHL